MVPYHTGGIMKGIVYQGKIIDPGFEIEVVDGREVKNPRPGIPDLWWDPKKDAQNCRVRNEPIAGGVIHYQAGEGDADNCFAVLNARPKKKRKGFVYLSVHFEIDQHGVITQMADLETVCKHAGNANGWSWGVEIANNGRGKPSPNWPRDSYMDTMHGRPTQYLAFYQAQKEATAELVKAVHTILGLGMSIPADDEGRWLRMELADEEMEGHEVFGHANLTDNKPDPSPDLMDYLIKNLPQE